MVSKNRNFEKSPNIRFREPFNSSFERSRRAAAAKIDFIFISQSSKKLWLLKVSVVNTTWGAQPSHSRLRWDGRLGLFDTPFESSRRALEEQVLSFFKFANFCTKKSLKHLFGE